MCSLNIGKWHVNDLYVTNTHSEFHCSILQCRRDGRHMHRMCSHSSHYCRNPHKVCMVQWLHVVDGSHQILQATYRCNKDTQKATGNTPSTWQYVPLNPSRHSQTSPVKVPPFRHSTQSVSTWDIYRMDNCSYSISCTQKQALMAGCTTLYRNESQPISIWLLLYSILHSLVLKIAAQKSRQLLVKTWTIYSGLCCTNYEQRLRQQ